MILNETNFKNWDHYRKTALKEASSAKEFTWGDIEGRMETTFNGYQMSIWRKGGKEILARTYNHDAEWTKRALRDEKKTLMARGMNGDEATKIIDAMIKAVDSIQK